MGVIQLHPHNNMTVKECLEFASRNHDEYQDVIIVGFDTEGEVSLLSSHISRSDALWIMLEAVDQVRGK